MSGLAIFVNPLTDALWAIDDHHHATKASITTDQKFQSIESDRLLTCLEVFCV